MTKSNGCLIASHIVQNNEHYFLCSCHLSNSLSLILCHLLLATCMQHDCGQLSCESVSITATSCPNSSHTGMENTHAHPVHSWPHTWTHVRGKMTHNKDISSSYVIWVRVCKTGYRNLFNVPNKMVALLYTNMKIKKRIERGKAIHPDLE